MKQPKYWIVIACFALMLTSFVQGCGNEEELTPEAPPAEVMAPEPGGEETIREAEQQRTYEKEMTERSQEREDL
jgi:hypothetical protein